MKVLFIQHASVLGGASVSLLNLIQNLRRDRGVEIVVGTYSAAMRALYEGHAVGRTIGWPDPLTIFGRVLIWGITPLEWNKFRLFLAETIRLPKTIGQQRRLLREVSPDIVHLNSSVLFSTALAARLEGIPVVWHVREMLSGGALSLRKRFVGALIRRLASRVIAISEPTAGCLGCDTANVVRVVHNPVDMARFDAAQNLRQECRSRLGLQPKDKVLLTLGGVSHWKGMAPLIDAMNYLGDDVQLLVAGPSVLHPEAAVSRATRLKLFIEDILVRLRVQSMPLVSYMERVRLALQRCHRVAHVHFVGTCDDVPALIAAADILVFAGMGPHFPRPVFEAWAMKKPVVVFLMDGISNEVHNGVDGVIVYPRTGRALAQALCDLLADPKTMQRMGQQGYEKALALMNPQRGADAVVETYEALLRDVRQDDQ